MQSDIHSHTCPLLPADLKRVILPAAPSNELLKPFNVEKKFQYFQTMVCVTQLHRSDRPSQPLISVARFTLPEMFAKTCSSENEFFVLSQRDGAAILTQFTL